MHNNRYTPGPVGRNLVIMGGTDGGITIPGVFVNQHSGMYFRSMLANTNTSLQTTSGENLKAYLHAIMSINAVLVSSLICVSTERWRCPHVYGMRMTTKRLGPSRETQRRSRCSSLSRWQSALPSPCYVAVRLNVIGVMSPI